MPFDWLHKNVNGRRGPIAVKYFRNDQLNTATDVKPIGFIIYLHLTAASDFP